MKTLKNMMLLLLSALLTIQFTSCTDDLSGFKSAAPMNEPANFSSMRCLIDNKPWVADNSGSNANRLQVEYSQGTASLYLFGTVYDSPNSYRAINFRLRNVDLATMPLNEMQTIDVKDSTGKYQPVVLVMNEFSGYKYLAPSKTEKSFVNFELVSREDKYALVKGTFEITFPESLYNTHTARQGEFEIRIALGTESE